MGKALVRTEPRQIMLVSQARKALAEARSIDEVKDIRDKAEAMRLYLRQRDESLEAQNAAAEIKLWAERRAGELLKGMPKKHGARPADTDSHDESPSVGEIGVDHNQSSRWQQIASLSEDEFERHIEDAKAGRKELTTNGVLKVAKEKKLSERRENKRTELKAKAKAAPKSDAWEIRVGDCLDMLKTIPPGSARLVFADPPYNIGIDYGDHHNDAMPEGEFVAWSCRWIKAAARTLAADGSMWVLIGDEFADHYGILLREAGLHRRAWIKWYETFGVNNTNNFNRTSRHLFYCVKDPKRFVFHVLPLGEEGSVRRESDRQAKYGDKRAATDGKVWDDVWGVNPPIPRLVGTAAERIPDFPTQLPLLLLLPIVGCASDPGDLVLDPFNGSGTTGEAALRLGRRYLGIEKSPRFAELSRMRLSAAEVSRDQVGH
jgi:DNA modification methylase